MNKLSPAPFAIKGSGFTFFTYTANAKGEFIGLQKVVLLAYHTGALTKAIWQMTASDCLFWNRNNVIFEYSISSSTDLN